MRKFWAQHSGFGFHAEDRPLIAKDKMVRWTLRQAIAHEWEYRTKSYQAKLHENLIPGPYRGNLSKARVFILMLNPGYSTACYLEDHRDLEHKAQMFDNLAQRLDHFPWLDPKLLRSTGYGYWSRWFEPIIGRMVGEGFASLEAAQRAAAKVAVIQSCPYHSYRSPGAWVHELPSSRVARSFVRNVLAQRARKGEISIIVPRAKRIWGLRPEKHILVRERNFRSTAFNAAEVDEILMRCR